MTYYILPSNKIKFEIVPCTKGSSEPLHISHSVNYYSNLILGQINKVDQFEHAHNNIYSFEQVSQFVNPYQFIFSKIPSYKCAVSKMASNSNVLYELIEISCVCNIFESFKYKSQINVYHIGNASETIDLMKLFRSNDYSSDIVSLDYDVNNIVVNLQDDNVQNHVSLSNCDLLFFNVEYDHSSLSEYFNKIIKILFTILSIQNINGISIIKVSQMHHKLLIDVLYILNSYFTNVFIIKPNCSSIIENTHYIVCKFFTDDTNNRSQNLSELQKIFTCTTADKQQINSLLDIKTPYLFLNKIEEFNVIIGQQQLDGYFQIINILKNKNKEEKFETLKRNNIIKCIQWCEKYHVPYNKIMEKNNMFNGQKTPKNMFNGKQSTDETDLEESCDPNVIGYANMNLNTKLSLESFC